MKQLGYFLMGAAVLIPTAGVSVFLVRNGLGDPKDFISLALVALFMFVTVSTMGLIVLASSKAIELEPGFLRWLAGATIAEVAGMCTLILKALYK